MSTEQLPNGLDSGFHRDLRGRSHEPWVRRAVLAALLGVVVLALLDVFGQQPQDSQSMSPQAVLSLSAPTRARGGLLFQARAEINAKSAIGHPRLVLADGWIDQLQVNTIEPSPIAETSRGGHLQLNFDGLDPGERLTVWMEFQANPLSIGHRDQTIQLFDGHRLLTTITRSLTVFP
jgi:hypothetical protein